MNVQNIEHHVGSIIIIQLDGYGGDSTQVQKTETFSYECMMLVKVDARITKVV